jgi:glycolate oxidase
MIMKALIKEFEKILGKDNVFQDETDWRNHEEWERVERAFDAIFDRALELGGTLSGEHGIGMAKSRFLEKETSRATILYSRRIKAALDPKNILNPGKIIGD